MRSLQLAIKGKGPTRTRDQLVDHPEAAESDDSVVAPLIPPPKPRVVPPPRPERQAAAGADIVQFSASIYYLDEAEGYLEVDVMRLGNMTGRASVLYETEDGSGKAGISYRESRGKLIFEDGEATKSFKVKAVQNDLWAPTMEFQIVLKDPQNAILGAYLKKCRVKVMNDDCFPSDAFDKSIMQSEQAETMAGVFLWWEYFRLNYAQPSMRWRTLLVLFVDQLAPAYLYFRISFQVYLVDVVFNLSDPESSQSLLIPGHRDKTALICGAIYVVPPILLHLWDVWKVHIGIKGRSLGFLQESLFRKYLNYSEKSRAEVAPSDMLVAITSDCTAVADSYMCALNMITKIAKILVLSNFIVQRNRGAAWIIVVMPLSILLFALLRTRKQMRIVAKTSETEVAMMSLVNEVCQKYRLVADYAQRPFMNQVFSARAAEYRASLRPEVLVLMNSEYFPSFLGVGFVGFFISTNAPFVLHQEMSLGTFLATIQVFNEISGAFNELYKAFVQVTKSFEPLCSLAMFYNKPTDLPENKELNRESRQRTKDSRATLFADSRREGSQVSGGYLTDRLDIMLVDVHHWYSQAGGRVLSEVCLSASQGELVAVVGDHASGRATLLRLVGKVVFPEKGHIVIPTHLRVVHITKDPILMRMKLWENLTFGLGHATEADLPRVTKILEMFKGCGGQRIVALLKQQREDARRIKMQGGVEEKDHLWQDAMTSTERASVHLARAFIMNPEIVVLQRPFSNFNAHTSEVVIRIFQDFVKHRGVCLPDAEEASRRPRTLFFIPEEDKQADCATLIWSLDRNDGRGSTVTETKRRRGDVT